MKLLIVDDNKYVVELLRKQLNWEAFGIDELIGVYSVQQAKEILQNTEIDFLITDIEMPVQNGFDLLEWIREQGLKPETVLLTSYADFSYAQLAVKYQCFEYLLKPVDKTVLEEIVRRLVTKRIDDRKQHQLQKYGNNWISHQSLVREMFWRDVVSDENPLSEEEVCQKIEKNQLEYENTQGFMVMLICLGEEKEGFGRNLLSFTCENVLREIATEEKIVLEFLSYNGYAQFIAIFSSLEQSFNEQMCRIANRFIEIFNPFYHSSVTCYISDISTIPEINGHVNKLEEIFLDNLNRESGVFTEKEFAKCQKAVYHAPEIDEWRALILERRLDFLEKRVHDYFADVKQIQPIDSSFLHAVLADWNMMSVNILKECNLTTYQVVTRLRNRELEERAVISVSCMERLILSEAAIIADQINYVEKEDRVIADIKAYVKQHLDNVTRSQIASDFYLSPGYLSKLFRKQTGLSLSEYIQKSRMREARRLLLESELGISQIAEEVGYPSFAHFSKQFKKMNGMTPNEYRKKEGQENSPVRKET